MPEKILVTRVVVSSIFFVWIEYEIMPKYCNTCWFLGHDNEGCRRKENERINNTSDSFISGYVRGDGKQKGGD